MELFSDDVNRRNSTTASTTPLTAALRQSGRVLTLRCHCAFSDNMTFPERWVFRFFVAVMSVDMTIGFAVVASARGAISIDLPTALMVVCIYSPAIVAIALAGIEDGRAGITSILRPLLFWRVRLRWYAIALLLPFAINALALGLFTFRDGDLPPIPGDVPRELQGLAAEPVLLYLNLTMVQIMGGLGEEIGWRGYALPRLQVRHSAARASLLIGAVWTFWHVPLFLLPGTTQSEVPFAWYVLYVPAVSVLFTWLYNQAGGSLLIVTLFHASIQAANVYLPIIAPESLYALSVLVTAGIALAVMGTFGPNDLSTNARVTTATETMHSPVAPAARRREDDGPTFPG